MTQIATQYKPQEILNRAFDDSTNRMKTTAESLPLPSGASTSAKQDDILAELQTKRNYEYMGKKTVGDYTYFGFKERGSTHWKIMRKDNTDDSAWVYAYSEIDTGVDWTTGWADPTTLTYAAPPNS